MFRKVLIFLLLMGLAIPAHAKDIVEFDGKEYVLVFANKKANFVNEFIPKGQKLEYWTTMLASRYFHGIKDTQLFANNMLKSAKTANPDAQGAVFHNNQTGNTIVDYVTWDKQLFEHNMWRIIPVEDGVWAYQFARRGYKDDMSTHEKKAFFADIKKHQAKWATMLNRTQLPAFAEMPD
jgi:hypothetical protein